MLTTIQELEREIDQFHKNIKRFQRIDEDFDVVGISYENTD